MATSPPKHSSGNRTNAYTYDAFGAPNDPVPSNSTTERWAGRWDKQLDTSANMIQMGARPYDPTLGRFLSVDPIDGGSLNGYDYATQDPINGYDLDGTKTGGPGDSRDRISRLRETRKALVRRH